MDELKQTLLSDPDPDERIGAVLMLTGEEGPESLRMLLDAMDDPDPEVRLAVVEALGDRTEEISPDTLTVGAARSRCGSALRGGQHPRRHGESGSAGDGAQPRSTTRTRTCARSRRESSTSPTRMTRTRTTTTTHATRLAADRSPSAWASPDQ